MTFSMKDGLLWMSVFIGYFDEVYKKKLLIHEKSFMYQQSFSYRSSGILPVSLLTFFLGPQMARPKYCRVLSDTFPIFEINSS